MLSAIVLSALVAQTANPPPQPTPPQEITHVRTRAVCTALRQVVTPSIGVLAENDATIARGVKVLEANSQFSGQGESLGGLHLKNDISSIAQNLDTLGGLLKDAPDAASVDGSDHADIEMLKNKIRAVADADRAELDIFNGTIATGNMNQQMRAGDDNGVASDGWSGPGADPTQSFARTSSSVAPNDMRELSDAASRDETVIADRERTLTQAVMPIAAQCGPAASPPPKP
jgi:hypothetical protein